MKELKGVIASILADFLGFGCVLTGAVTGRLNLTCARGRSLPCGS
jgi:hypothetical protein